MNGTDATDDRTGAAAPGSDPGLTTAPPSEPTTDPGPRTSTPPSEPTTGPDPQTSTPSSRPRTDPEPSPVPTSGRRRFRFPTALLLTCAALGVAGGLLLAPANWLSTILFPGLPFVSVGLAGLRLLPSVIALRLLRRPLVGLLVGLLAGLVIVPFSGYGFGSVATNLWWAAFTELPFLFVMWRYWGTWLHYVGAVVVGIVYPLLAWASFDLGSFPTGTRVLFFAITLASCLGGTALGILIADRLRAAGVGPRR